MASVEPLVKAVGDLDFAGRGYAAWALAKVIEPIKERPAEALKVLEEAAKSSDPYVKALSVSGLRVLAREH